jgi:hypothetical protein
MPPRPRRRVLTSVEPLRFAAAWRLLGPAADLPDDAIHVDVVRARDLVALSVTFTGCELVTGGGTPAHLRPKEGETARMTVHHTFQHGFEEAIYESKAPVPDPKTGELSEEDDEKFLEEHANRTPEPPVGFRPARASRVVYDVPVGETIELSTAGILAAMTRLELVVHPLALPGDAPARGSTGKLPKFRFDFPVINVGDGLIARVLPEGAVIEKATAAVLREHPAPDTTTLAGVLEHARNLRLVRTELSTRTGSVGARTTIPEGSIFSPGSGLIPDIIGPLRPRRTLSRPPTDGETAIEAPFRLVISPSTEARFAHADEVVTAEDTPDHVELWHSRLAHKPTTDGAPPDEKNKQRRIVRAVWARDRDWVGDAWTKTTDESQPTYPLSHARPEQDPTVDPPFLGSLDRFDRHMLVRQSSETWPGKSGSITPVPVGADALWLSGLGAWLDLHGAWTTKPYSEVQMQSILAWDHVAPLGRDQYVRVVYPGYLYPFGHQAALVKVTERKMKTPTNSVASLYQRMFLVLGERSRTYGARNLPFTRLDVRPVVTPVIDPLGNTEGNSQVSFFWPTVAGQRFSFTVEALDQAGRPVRLQMPLMWVSEAYNSQAQRAKVDKAYADSPSRQVPAHGQPVAFVRQEAGPDTDLATTSLWFLGRAGLGDSVPRLSSATVSVPAVQQISPTEPLPIRYFQKYVDSGFDKPGVGDVWAEVNLAPPPTPAGHPDPTTPLPQMRFGAGAPAGSDKAGGFLSPDLPIRGLSRADGPIGDLTSVASGSFDPAAFLAGALPKLFGLIPLDALIPEGLLSEAPTVVTETLGRIDQCIKDVERLVAQAQAAVDEAQKLVDRAQDKAADLQAQANQAKAKAEQVAQKATAFATELTGLFATSDLAQLEAKIPTTFAKLDTIVVDVRALTPLLPPQARTGLDALADALETVSDAADLVQQILDFVQGFDPTEIEASFRFEWKPRLQSWPSGDALFEVGGTGEDNLVLSVEGRAGGTGTADVVASAEIRDFALKLFPKAPLMRVPFDHMFFKAGSSGKPEVDVVLGEIEFLGVLSFVEVIKDLIPFDGFSDPPYLDVTAEGATAGFTLALPSVAIGVFNLSNMSLGADVSVPFLGKAVTVGFNFCTRERPFTLTVMALGGGGWFLIRVAPDGLDVLELGLEAGAALSVDFGVASGSISALIGIYIRLEGEQGSLTGYFRLRGEVDVLGLISASIELYMELLYDFPTGKMIGRATITVEVEVLFFSGTVRISAERKLAGSNGDPSFREILGAESGTSPAWDQYCLAFAEE